MQNFEPPQDPNAPSNRAAKGIQTKNNIMDMKLKREIACIEIEEALAISLIDQDRLSIRDFLAELRRCTSDDLPETRIWLGKTSKRGNKKKELKRRGTVDPEAIRRSISLVGGKVAEKLEREREEKRAQEELEIMRGQAFAQYKPCAINPNMALAFSRKNQYVNESKSRWETEGENWESVFPQKDPTQETEPSPRVGFKMDSQVQGDLSRNGTPEKRPSSQQSFDSFSNRTDQFSGGRSEWDSRPTTAAVSVPEGYIPPSHDGDIIAMRASDNRRKSAVREKLENIISQAIANTKKRDFMKEILENKSKVRKPPLEERIHDFFVVVEEIKAKQKALGTRPSAIEIRKTWQKLTEGVKAALLEQSESEDEDDNNLHTL